MKKLTAAITTLAAAVTTLGAVTPATANAQDSSVSIAAYCARNVSSGTAAPSQATNINNRWDGWRCGTRVGLVGVDVATACRQQVSPNATAVVVNQSANGWRCRT